MCTYCKEQNFNRSKRYVTYITFVVSSYIRVCISWAVCWWILTLALSFISLKWWLFLWLQIHIVTVNSGQSGHWRDRRKSSGYRGFRIGRSKIHWVRLEGAKSFVRMPRKSGLTGVRIYRSWLYFKTYMVNIIKCKFCRLWDIAFFNSSEMQW